MISSHIFYFSLLSVFWISFVRAALTPAQNTEMRFFFDAAMDNLRTAFHGITETTVDVYFQEVVLDFHHALGPYLADLDATVRHGRTQAPQPQVPGPLNFALAGVPGNFYLIKYSNLSILNDLKKVLVSTFRMEIIPATLLGMIDDDNVTSAWNDYVTYRNAPQRLQLEVYIVDIAVLFSMNRAMLVYIPPNHPLCSGAQVTRLKHYQTLIGALHSHLAGYMQTQPLASYNNMFQNIQDDFARLGRAAMPDTIQIRDVAYELCVTILSMIAIYGRPRDVRLTSYLRKTTGTHLVD
jgi:hypothetical protein